MMFKVSKIIQQVSIIVAACFLIGVALYLAFALSGDIGDVDLGFHGNIALILTVVLGFAFGAGLAGVFFYLARCQTDDE